MLKNFFKQRSLVDKVRYWDLQQGIVFLTDGTVEFAIEFQLPSTLMLSSSGVEMYSKAMRSLIQQAAPERSRVRVYIESTTAGPDVLKEFNDMDIENEFLRAIHQEDTRMLNELRLTGQMQNWHFTLTVSVPPTKTRNKTPYSDNDLINTIEKINQLRTRFVTLLETAGMNPQALDSQKTFEFIWRWFNPGMCSARPPTYVPHNKIVTHSEKTLQENNHIQTPTFKRQLLGSEIDNTDPAYLIVDNRYVSSVSMQQLPENAYAGIAEQVIRRLGGYHFYVVLDFEHLDQGHLKRDLNRKNRQMVVNAQEGFGGIADPSNQAQAQELTDLLSYLQVSGDHVFKLGMSVMLFARSKQELEEMKELTVSGFSEMQAMLPVVGNHPTITLFTENLAPCHGITNNYSSMVVGNFASDFFPVASPWRGSDKPVLMFTNRWGSITRINPLDPRASAWNVMIAAQSGHGKTFLTQKLLTGCLWQNAKLIIVDQGQSYYSLIEGCGGTTVVLKPGESVSMNVNHQSHSINPFDLPENLEQPDAEKKAFLLAFLRSLIPDSVEDRGIENTILNAAIEQLYQRYSEPLTDQNGEEHMVYTGGATLSSFVNILLNLQKIGRLGVREGDDIAKIANKLAVKLQAFIGDTPYGQLFDRPTNVDLNHNILYFDAHAIKKDKTLTAVSLLIIADLVWKKAKEDRDSLKVAVFEEFGVLSQIPEAAAFVAELYRTARTYKLSVVGISQSFKDFAKVDGIIVNTNFIYAGPIQKEEDFTSDFLALTDEGRGTYESLRLMKRQYSEFLAMIRIGDRLEGDVIQCRVGPIAYWSYSSDPDDKERRYKALQHTAGNVSEAVQLLASGWV